MDTRGDTHQIQILCFWTPVGIHTRMTHFCYWNLNEIGFPAQAPEWLTFAIEILRKQASQLKHQIISFLLWNLQQLWSSVHISQLYWIDCSECQRLEVCTCYEYVMNMLWISNWLKWIPTTRDMNMLCICYEYAMNIAAPSHTDPASPFSPPGPSAGSPQTPGPSGRVCMRGGGDIHSIFITYS